jgi:hypothetical protein
MCDSSFARKDTLRRYARANTLDLAFDTDSNTGMSTMDVHGVQRSADVPSKSRSHSVVLLCTICLIHMQTTSNHTSYHTTVAAFNQMQYTHITAENTKPWLRVNDYPVVCQEACW